MPKMVSASCAPKLVAIVTSLRWWDTQQRSPPGSGSRPRANGSTIARTANSSKHAFFAPRCLARPDGIEKYLSSGMIRGVGPVYAKKLVRAFGEKVFDVIEATPDRLREVDLELQEGMVVADRVGETPCVFLAGLHRAERASSRRD